MFQRLLHGLTGAEAEEQASVVLSFFALLFLLLAYYLVKPLRDSLFMMHFEAKDLAFLSLPVIVLSLGITKLFNHWVGRIPRYRLMMLTYAIMMLLKALFFLILPLTGKWGIVAFYLFISTYFTLVLSLLWGVINSIFSPQQAERSFGFVMFGSTLGNILGAKLSGWLVHSPFKDGALPLSLISMGIALGLVLWAAQLHAGAEPPSSTEKSQVSRGIQDILMLFRNRYVRGIAMMVFALALTNMIAIQFQAYAQLDRSSAKDVYHAHFAWADPQQLQFESIYSLKQLSESKQTQQLTQLMPQNPERAQASYQGYRKSLENKVRGIFSDIYAYQGIAGAVLLLLIAPLLFRWVGLRWVVLILPGFFLLSSVLLWFPLELAMIQLLIILAGALNYSLNNATKELLYTPTSESVRFQLKPLIEGPIMRLGDLSASLLQIAVASSIWALSSRQQSHVLSLLSVLFIVLWAVFCFETARRYDRAKGNLSEALDQHA